MDGMYKENQEHSINSMSRHSKIWGIDSSPLTMALESSNYDIVAHISSKKNMDRIWENNFESNIFQKKTKVYFTSLYYRPLVATITIPPVNSVEYARNFTIIITGSYTLNSVNIYLFQNQCKTEQKVLF